RVGGLGAEVVALACRAVSSRATWDGCLAVMEVTSVSTCEPSARQMISAGCLICPRPGPTVKDSTSGQPISLVRRWCLLARPSEVTVRPLVTRSAPAHSETKTAPTPAATPKTTPTALPGVSGAAGGCDHAHEEEHQGNYPADHSRHALCPVDLAFDDGTPPQPRRARAYWVPGYTTCPSSLVSTDEGSRQLDSTAGRAGRRPRGAWQGGRVLRGLVVAAGRGRPGPL